ncbi:MAG: TonB family protein [Candidatus Omnitrophica bacterium]|nr:TonB family protein [Candidatus Omnitrophota bacterium]
MVAVRLSSGNWFYPILAVSLVAHLLVIWRTHAAVQPPEFSVRTAPSSISISIVKMAPPPPPRAVSAAPPKLIPVMVSEMQSTHKAIVIPRAVVEKFTRRPPESPEPPVELARVEPAPVPLKKPVEDVIPDAIAEPLMADAVVPKTILSDKSAGAAREAEPLGLVNPAPSYPAVALRRRWEGTVRLSVEVSAEGTVEQVTITESSGHALLDRSARQTVETWHFQPALKGNRNTASVITVPVEFRLKDRL